jgi:hypothetical protein
VQCNCWGWQKTKYSQFWAHTMINWSQFNSRSTAFFNAHMQRRHFLTIVASFHLSSTKYEQFKSVRRFQFYYLSKVPFSECVNLWIFWQDNSKYKNNSRQVWNFADFFFLIFQFIQFFLICFIFCRTWIWMNFVFSKKRSHLRK